MPRRFAFLLLIVGTAWAGEPVPHLGDAGQADFDRYQESAAHRAFAIAPGGAWAWMAGRETPAAAADAALARCAGFTLQTCVLYAEDSRVVFDAGRWATLLTLPASRVAPATGVARGQRFPDLRLKDPDGWSRTLSDYRGEVLVLHFWGSWCAPCRHEMPDLQSLAASMKGVKGVRFILLQVREPIRVSRTWARQHGLTLPLSDSGSQGDGQLSVNGGAVLLDRVIAAAFPTTYILDRDGRVLLAHVGPVPRWSEYRAQLLDAVKSSRG